MILSKPLACAVVALVCAAAFAADPPTDGKDALRAAAQACRGDAEKLCATVEKGGGRKLMCLREHTAELSPGCKDALGRADAGRRAAPPK